ncbi:MAG: hypothetical protein HY092_03900 [Candidatus Kerfeldbacteria bacterium]|nr:hypothetical protein [Candidatus Kerfeldbacteria bacterium]
MDHEAPRPSKLFVIVVVFLSATWLTLAVSVVRQQGRYFGSPDETANDVFIRSLATKASYTYQSSLTPVQLTFLHPRSTFVRGSTLSSGSFISFTQFGAVIDRLVGSEAHRYATPLLGLLSLLALFGVFHHFWGRWWSLLGTVLVGAHPAVFNLYTVPLLQNGGFTALLVISGWALLQHHQAPSLKFAVRFAILYGLAIFMRPVELLWTGPAIAVVLLTMSQGWRWFLVIVGIAGLMQTPWLVADAQQFGSALTSGYTPEGLVDSSAQSQTVLSPLFRLLTPVGGRWSWHWLSSVWWYMIMLIPAWSLAAVMGMAVYFRRKFVDRKKLIKIGFLIVIFCFLGAYYGSWNLYPATAAARVGFAASYVRYWLPLYVAMGAGFIVFLRVFRPWPKLLLITLVTVVLSGQVYEVWSHPVSGIKRRLDQAAMAKSTMNTVWPFIPANAIVVAGQDDKWFWPSRTTSYDLPHDPKGWTIVREALASHTLFLYVVPGQFPSPNWTKDVPLYGLRARVVRQIGTDTLWQIEAI